MYRAYQSGQSGSRCPVSSSYLPCAASARRSASMSFTTSCRPCATGTTTTSSLMSTTLLLSSGTDCNLRSCPGQPRRARELPDQYPGRLAGQASRVYIRLVSPLDILASRLPGGTISTDPQTLHHHAIDSRSLALLRRVRGDDLPEPAAVIPPGQHRRGRHGPGKAGLLGGARYAAAFWLALPRFRPATVKLDADRHSHAWRAFMPRSRSDSRTSPNSPCSR